MEPAVLLADRTLELGIGESLAEFVDEVEPVIPARLYTGTTS